MKRLLFFISCVGLVACNNVENESEKGISADAVAVGSSAVEKTTDLPEIKFAEVLHDFGKITQGERVSHTFRFENTGNTALIITGAEASCGCTVPDWPRDPIAPGEKGKIEVMYNSEGRSGYQEKTITVVTNCEPSTRILRIKAEVVVPSSMQ